jgi:hypothetical protein
VVVPATVCCWLVVLLREEEGKRKEKREKKREKERKNGKKIPNMKLLGEKIKDNLWT